MLVSGHLNRPSKKSNRLLGTRCLHLSSDELTTLVGTSGGNTQVGRRASLGELELEALRFVTDREALTVAEVVAGFGEPKGLARTTIITVLERLRAKGHLTRHKVNGVYRYSAKVSQVELLKRLVGDFVKGSLGGSISPIARYITEAQDLSPEEIAELKRIVAQLPDSPETQK